MPIFVLKARRINLNKREESPQWYAYAKTTTTVTSREVAKQIVAGTRMAPEEAEMVIARLKEVVLENIMNGHTVMLGDWGYFYPSLSSEPSESMEEVTTAKIKKVKLHLKLSKEIEKELANANYLFVEDLLYSPDK